MSLQSETIPSRDEILGLLEVRRLELKNVEAEFKEAQKRTMDARNIYNQLSLAAVHGKGSPVGSGARQIELNKKHANYHLQRKIDAAKVRDKAEADMKALVAKKAQLQNDIEKLQSLLL